MVTADHGGYVKYWQSNMNNVKMFQAHKEPIRALRCAFLFSFIHLIHSTLLCVTRIFISMTHNYESTLINYLKGFSPLLLVSDPNSAPIKVELELLNSMISHSLYSFCPTDTKFATCSDDGTVRIWDFLRCCEERILRGHGADVKGVDWHPTRALVVSGSKDSQQPIKLWDPKTGQSIATM